MRQRRLLIISYHFPPDGAVGGLRWSGLSKYLARRGWEVHVITAAPQAATAASVPGVHVHFVKQRYTLNDGYNAWMNGRRATSPAVVSSIGSAPSTAAPVASSTSIFGWFRTTFGEALSFPDVGRGWILGAANTARDLLRHDQFDVVVSSGPPHSVHIAAALACAGSTTPRVIDMRDPWAYSTHTPSSEPRPHTVGLDAVLPAIERQVLRGARQAVANTSEFADILRMRYPRKRIVFISNGVDPERLPPPAKEKFPGLVIAYAGTMYLDRNLTTVLRAMRDLFARTPSARGHCTLRVAGSMDGPHAAQFLEEVAANGLEGSVVTLGNVTGAEALDLVNRSHLTLVLAQNQPTQVPAKLYECVAMGVPTLVITEPTSAAAREARRIGAMVCPSADVSPIAALLEKLLDAPAPTARPSVAIGYDVIAEQMEAVLLASSTGDPPA